VEQQRLVVLDQEMIELQVEIEHVEINTIEIWSHFVDSCRHASQR